MQEIRNDITKQDPWMVGDLFDDVMMEEFHQLTQKLLNQQNCLTQKGDKTQQQQNVDSHSNHYDYADDDNEVASPSKIMQQHHHQNYHKNMEKMISMQNYDNDTLTSPIKIMQQHHHQKNMKQMISMENDDNQATPIKIMQQHHQHYHNNMKKMLPMQNSHQL